MGEKEKEGAKNGVQEDLEERVSVEVIEKDSAEKPFDTSFLELRATFDVKCMKIITCILICITNFGYSI